MSASLCKSYIVHENIVQILFIFSATNMAKKLAEFISILNKEDVSRLDCQQEICKVSNKIFLRPYLTEIFLPRLQRRTETIIVD